MQEKEFEKIRDEIGSHSHFKERCEQIIKRLQ